MTGATSLIAGNHAAVGGGVRVDQGSVAIIDGQVRGNTADFGGGVYVNNSTATLSGGQIVSNTVSYYGGGVYLS